MLVKLILLFKIKKLASELITKSEDPSSSQSELWILFLLPRQMNTIECSMMSREDSPLSRSKKLRPNSNY